MGLGGCVGSQEWDGGMCGRVPAFLNGAGEKFILTSRFLVLASFSFLSSCFSLFYFIPILSFSFPFRVPPCHCQFLFSPRFLSCSIFRSFACWLRLSFLILFYPFTPFSFLSQVIIVTIIIISTIVIITLTPTRYVNSGDMLPESHKRRRKETKAKTRNTSGNLTPPTKQKGNREVLFIFAPVFVQFC